MRYFMNTELIITLVGAFVTIITAILTNYFTKKNQLRFEERKLKEKYYTNYLQAISANVLMKGEDGCLDDAQNRLLLIGNAEVVTALMALFSKTSASAPPLPGEEHDRLLTELMKAMRADLYGRKSVNKGYPLVHLAGVRRHPDDIKAS